MLVVDPGTAPAVTVLPGHLDWALALAVGFSFVLASIEISNESKRPMRSCLVFPSFLYCSIRAFGNVVATLLALILVARIDPALANFYWLFAAFLGIFSFETILKNMNVTVAGAGILTLQAWMDKALNAASAASIERDLQRTQIDIQKLASRLSEIDGGDLNAFVVVNLANQVPNIVDTLEKTAAANKANPRLHKGYAVATVVTRSQVIAFLKLHEKR
ncbi:MAG: hypothetical protein ABR907_05080 [Terracidiphilus sp.]|jgi:hypothetical protein